MQLGRVAALAIGMMLVMSAASARASTLLATWTEACGIGCDPTDPTLVDFSFNISSNPTPISFIDNEVTVVPIWNCVETVGGVSGACGTSAVFYNGSTSNPLVQALYCPIETPAPCGFQASFAFPGGGGVTLSGNTLYGGPEGAPTFGPGSSFAFEFILSDDHGGTFTFSVAPEPETWALMIAALFGLGADLRRRRALPA